MQDLRGEKKVVYDLWKKGKATQEMFKDVIRSCRYKVRKGKAHLELNLATAMKESKKCFYKYISNKKRTEENLHPLLIARGNIVTKDEEKGELMPSLPQSLTVRLVILRAARPISW